MFCPECGTKNQDDAVFCENCGVDISQALKQSQAAQPTNKNGNPQQPQTDPPKSAENQNYTYSASAAAAAPHTPMTLRTKIILASILLAAVLVVVFFYVGGQMSSSAKVAQNYFEALKSNDWDKAYSYLNITESDFINKGNFVKMQKESGINPGIVNYSISSKKAYTSDESNENGALTKNIEMQYTTKNSSEPQTMDIKLIKQPEKMWLFFDKWKVSSTDYIEPEVTITVPYGTTAYLNNTKISDKYKDNSSSSGGTADSSEKQSVTYKLKNIFIGKYDLKVTSPYIEDFMDKMDLNEYSSFTVSNLKLKKDILDTVSKKPEQIIKDIYAAALAGKDFDSVADYFVTDEDARINLKNEYSNLQRIIAKGTDGGIKSITFSDFDPQVTNSQADSDLFIKVDTKFDYSYTACYPSYGGTQQSYDGKDASDLAFTFQLAGDKWLVSSADGFTLPYYKTSDSIY